MGEKAGKCLAGFSLFIIFTGSGFLAAYLAALINGVHFGFYLWPLAACMDLFLFTTAGFFTNEGKAEVLYGACSIAGAVCIMVQLAILF